MAEENTTTTSTTERTGDSSASGELTLGQGAGTDATAARTTRREVKYVHGEAARKFGWWWGTGRRKRAVARVRLRPGNGEFKINGKEVNEYFTEPRDQAYCQAALKASNTEGKMDIFVKVHGGGYAGQAGAVLLGVARALRTYDTTLEDVLRQNGYLTRDARQVERKKYGQRGARRRFQFSKR